MKKALLSIAAMALLSSQGFAQITLKDTSFNNPVGTSDSLRYVIDGFNSNAGNMVNLIYTNHTWDLLQNNYVTSSSQPNWKVISYTNATGYTYSANQMDTLNHITTGSTTAPIFVYPAGILTTMNSTSGGILEHGRRIQATGYSISALPGANTNDSVKIFAQDAMYYQTTIGNMPTTRMRLEFPATYNTSTVAWQNNYQDTIKATITYGTTYNGDTIQVKETVTEQYAIQGWGKMMIKLPSGANSVYFNVLQVRVMSQVSDSFFVEGVPIPQLTLTALGVTQGQVRLMYYDEYYRPDYVVPFAHIRHTDANRTAVWQNKHMMHVQHYNPASVEGLVNTMSNIEVYPNPVKDGMVNVSINGSQKDWNYSVINISGQSVKAGKLNVNGGKAQVALPANLPAGTYQMLLENGEQTIVKPLSIVE